LHPFSHSIQPKDDGITKIRLASTLALQALILIMPSPSLTPRLSTARKINNKLNFGVYLFEVKRQYSLTLEEK
jgi:hypothetical protein